MTQSRIERLLEKMSVQCPSDALDARIQQCLADASVDASKGAAASTAREVSTLEASRGNAAVAEVGGSARRTASAWPTVAVVAVASLLLGVMLGHSFSEPSALAARWSAGPSPDNLPAEATGGLGTDAMATALQDSGWLQQISAPDVALMCAAAIPQPSVGERGDHQRLACVTCHTGLPEARRQFLARHTAHDTFVACRLCHESDEMENL